MIRKTDVPYRNPRLLWIGVFLLSFSLIAFEIALTRLLSVLLSYHFVFLVLSIALLGLGCGGLIARFLKPRISHDNGHHAILSFWTSLFAISIPLAVFTLILTGSSPYLRNLALYGVILLIPFALAGVVFAFVYRSFSEMSTRIYGADLLGAATGSVGAIFLLNGIGGIACPITLGIISSLSAFIFASQRFNKTLRGFVAPLAGFCIPTLLLGAILLNISPVNMPIGGNPAKEIHDALHTFQGKIIQTKWSSFGRTDLIAYEDHPDHMDIYIDGTAGSPMFRFNGRIEDPGAAIVRLKSNFPGYFPFRHFKEHEKNNALIIGPGGGRDILLALMGEIQQIVAVEVNRDLVDIVCDYSGYNGGIYTDWENIEIFVDEGRHFLKRQNTKYDLILLSLPVTNTSRSLEGYALTENFLFTTESITDYLDHLTEEGHLVVVGHNDAEILRLLTLSITALAEQGISTTDAMNRLYITGSDDYRVLVMGNTPYDHLESFAIYQSMHQNTLQPMLSYFPYVHQFGRSNPALMALGLGQISLRDFVHFVGERGYDISPVSDNNPFFYDFEMGLPRPVSLVFWVSLILYVIVLLPLCIKHARWGAGGNPENLSVYRLFRPVALFSLLGMAFMLVEVSLIQRFGSFLGQPSLALAVSLGSLLAGGGIGSLCSGRLFAQGTHLRIGLICLLIASAILAYIILLPMVFTSIFGFGLHPRVIASILILLPLGFFMGMPFPLGLLWLKRRNLETYIPWLWCVNGVCSVLGAAMTLMIAITYGFTQALLVSAGCYFLIFLVFSRS